MHSKIAISCDLYTFLCMLYILMVFLATDFLIKYKKKQQQASCTNMG